MVSPNDLAEAIIGIILNYFDQKYSQTVGIDAQSRVNLIEACVESEGKRYAKVAVYDEDNITVLRSLGVHFDCAKIAVTVYTAPNHFYEVPEESEELQELLDEMQPA